VSEYTPVPQIRVGANQHAIREWVGSEPIRDLVHAFGGDADVVFAGDDLEAWLTRLDEFSDRWDSRQGAERNVAVGLDLTADQVRIVEDASQALGLTSGSEPQSDTYDHLLMLGGLLRACIARPAFAARLVLNGRIQVGSVTALGGHRPFRGDEFDLARKAGFADVSDEFSALDAGTRRAFGLGAPTSEEGQPLDIDNAAWSIRTYATSDGTQIRVAAAPSSQPELRRANTADSYAWFAQEVGKVSAGVRVLIITTAIYVPAQHAAAVRMLSLPFGAIVETVGMIPGEVIPELNQQFTPSNYLQEIRSAIRSLRELVQIQL
jgi:hypothetical protein